MQLNPSLLRTLKGAPISVFIALMLANQPVSAEWIGRTTGYSDKPVLSALKFLEENHFATRNERYGWQIAAGVQQLPIVVPDAQDNQPENSAILGDPELFRVGNIPGPLVASSSLTILETRKENLPTTSNQDPEKFRVEQNLAECDRQKIHEPARSKLAKMAHVTAEVIRAHCKNCKNLGQAIYRIEHDWVLPVDEATAPARVDEMPQVEEELPADAQAEAWWGVLAERLVEKMPRAEYLNYVPRMVQAWREGSVLVVLVGNRMTEDVILRHYSREDLKRLAVDVSQGILNQIRFVTE